MSGEPWPRGGSDGRDEPDGMGGNEPTLPLPAIEVERPSQLGRQVAIVFAIGAVALLAIVSAVAGTGGSGDDEATAEAAILSELCATHLMPVTEAVEQWAGVENWADRPDEEPDLGLMTAAALTELGAVEATAGLADEATDLEGRLDDATGVFDRASAVRAALERTTEELDAAGASSGCETDRLEAALARP